MPENEFITRQDLVDALVDRDQDLRLYASRVAEVEAQLKRATEALRESMTAPSTTREQIERIVRGEINIHTRGAYDPALVGAITDALCEELFGAAPKVRE